MFHSFSYFAAPNKWQLHITSKLNEQNLLWNRKNNTKKSIHMSILLSSQGPVYPSELLCVVPSLKTTMSCTLTAALQRTSLPTPKHGSTWLFITSGWHWQLYCRTKWLYSSYIFVVVKIATGTYHGAVTSRQTELAHAWQYICFCNTNSK